MRPLARLLPALAPLLLSAGPVAAAGAPVAPGASRPIAPVAPAGVERPTLTRLAWGSVNLLVHADTSGGVRVWAATTSGDRRMRSPDRQRAFAGRFDPAAVEPWTEAVAQLLHARRFAEGDTASAANASLLERDSAVVGIFRRREGDQLSERVFLYFAPPGGHDPLVIQGTAADALAFANAMLHAAALSRIAPPPPAGAGAIYHDNPIDEATCVAIERAVTPHYPPELVGAGVHGEVWAYFVVDSTGRARVDSFDPVLSDDVRFTQAVRRSLTGSRYRPATRDGRPVNALVAQRFVFIVP